MTISLRPALAGFALLSLAACANNMFSGQYFGPEVTGVIVHKSERKMYLLHGNEAVKIFNIELGSAPDGPKHFEGDGRTPEGAYLITYRNPHSSFHLSLEISYPNAADIAYARAHHKDPGGEIFIHGQSPYSNGSQDWTAGCIAVSNRDMDVVYAMVPPGTPIWIDP